MNRTSRQKAFLLPLALLSLMLTSIIAINGYVFIQNHIRSQSEVETIAKFMKQKITFENAAIFGLPINSEIVSSEIQNLSGMYNLALLSHVDVEGRASLIDEHLIILNHLLLNCARVERPYVLADAIANYVVSNSPLQLGFGILDLVNELDIPLDIGVKMLPCLRIAPRSYKVNLSLTSATTLSSYFDLNTSASLKLRNLLKTNSIPNHSALDSYLSSSHKDRNFSTLLMDTKITNEVDHKAMLLSEKGETFAYIDIIKEDPSNWRINRSFFLWTPIE